jgi:CubicO group peptidase (beta-lactamase class C family)
MLDGVKADTGVPGLAAAVTKDDRMVAIGCVGTRLLGRNDLPVTQADLFHLGSVTKSMTAVLAAMMVQRGLLKWDSTVADIFPEWRSHIRREAQGITLQQLLSHTAGLPASENERALYREASLVEGSLGDQRQLLARRALAQRLASPPGKVFLYSNTGYIIAGAMLEKVSGESWEELMRERLFARLDLSSGGFGPPARLGDTDQPWAHEWTDARTLKPVPPGPNADNPPFLGPAGTVHLAIEDFARYAAFLLTGSPPGDDRAPLLEEASLQILREPIVAAPPPGAEAASYGLGLGIVRLPGKEAPVFEHKGSNGMNTALFRFDPEHRIAIVAVTNAGGPPGAEAVQKVIDSLYREYAGYTPPVRPAEPPVPPPPAPSHPSPRPSKTAPIVRPAIPVTPASPAPPSSMQRQRGLERR